MRKIKFKGQEFLLISGTDDGKEGAIATRKMYENFETSYAHLFRDGRVLQFGKQIGSIDDIEFLPEEAA